MRTKAFNWWLGGGLLLLYVTGEGEGAARFISHVPREDYSTDFEDPYGGGGVTFDSDVKLPGRHYPKLPYQHWPNQAPHYNQHHIYNHDTYSHDSRYQQNYNNPHGQNHQQNYNQPTSVQGRYNQQHNDQNSNNNYNWQTQDQQQSPIYDRQNTQPSVSEESYYYDEYGDWRTDQRDGEEEEKEKKEKEKQEEEVVPQTGPRFARDMLRSVTVQAGKSASLGCRVVDIADKSVSWMRHEDLHILTVDKYKYSTDKRLSVEFNEPKQEWILKIKDVTEEDAGMYECQISTKPVLSFIVNLDVIEAPATTTPFPSLRDVEDPSLEPRSKDHLDQHHLLHRDVPSAKILNGPEIFVHRGSLINLTCVIDHTTEPLLFIVWYHYDKDGRKSCEMMVITSNTTTSKDIGQVMDYDNTGADVHTRKSGKKTISNLLVHNADQKDSGKYTCKPSNGEEASVMLHVLNGEHRAAMQTNSSNSNTGPSKGLLLAATGVGWIAFVFFCQC